MIRLYHYDNCGQYKDFENFLFSGNKAVFDFASDKLTIDGTAYRISSINRCGEEPASQHDEFTFTNTDLDVNYELIRAHGLNTLLPAVIIYDNNGVKQGEANFKITRIDNNHVKLSLFDSIEGTWMCGISSK